MLIPVDATAQAYRETRAPFGLRTMMWIEARDRSSPSTLHSLGVWTGDDVETITVTDMWTRNTVNRVFYGAGEMLGIESLFYHTGLEVRPATVVLSALTPAVILEMREYDPSLARVQLWQRTYNATGVPQGDPEPLFKGFINDAPIPRQPPPGATATITVSLVSAVRLLSLPIPRRKSDEAQKRRDSSDRFRRYRGIAARFDVQWGTKG